MRNRKLLLGTGMMCRLWCSPKIIHGKENKVSFSLTELKCENIVDPLGIDNVTPHLSWKLKGDGVVDGQAFHEIQVASDSLLPIGGKADPWKSGKLKPDVSVMVPYQGLSLASRSLYCWRVRAQDRKRHVSQWSSVARLSVGLSNKERVHGVYIGPSPEGGKVCAPLLRKEAQIGELATTFLYVNSLGYHGVYVNGKKVIENVLTLAVPQLSKRSLMVTYGASSYLKEGENDLLIQLGQGWYKKTTFGVAYDGPLVKAELNMLRNGKWEVLTATDTSWRGRESGYSDTGNQYTLQFGGERVDGRIVPTNFSTYFLDKMRWYPVVEVNVPRHIVSPQMCEANKIHQTL